MNGRTTENATLNPCTAAVDRHTYGCRFLNICFYGHRLVRVALWRFVVDLYWCHGPGRKFFTARSGNSWTWYTPIGSFDYWW